MQGDAQNQQLWDAMKLAIALFHLRKVVPIWGFHGIPGPKIKHHDSVLPQLLSCHLPPMARKMILMSISKISHLLTTQRRSMMIYGIKSWYILRGPDFLRNLGYAQLTWNDIPWQPKYPKWHPTYPQISQFLGYQLMVHSHGYQGTPVGCSWRIRCNFTVKSCPHRFHIEINEFKRCLISTLGPNRTPWRSLEDTPSWFRHLRKKGFYQQKYDVNCLVGSQSPMTTTAPFLVSIECRAKSAKSRIFKADPTGSYHPIMVQSFSSIPMNSQTFPNIGSRLNVYTWKGRFWPEIPLERVKKTWIE